MQYIKSWMTVIVIILAGLLLVACGGSEETVKVEPAHVEEIAGSEFSRVTLTAKAAERLGIQTAKVSGGDMVGTQTFQGEVADPGQGLVLVSLDKGTLAKVDTTQPAHVLLNDDDEDEDDGWLAELFEPEDEDEDGDTDEDGEDEDEDEDQDESLFFTMANAQAGLTEGQPVFVKLPLAGSAAQSLTIPYSAVIYGLNGETWAYTNPEPLTYVRHPITIDYIDGGLAILLDGPSQGTDIVTIGVAELFGTETGVGK